jgi:SAM-dependent methyltransferase
MLDLAALRPGERVLDLGTGTGDQAFAAAARVGPEGHVLATDISAEMVAEAAAGAARVRLGNVDTRVLDVTAIELKPDRWDAVISRLGLMLAPDLAAALTGAHRVLRDGGRIAVIVRSTRERNPFHATPLAVLQGLGRPAPSDAELVRAFSLAAPGVLARALKAARFRDVVVDSVPAPRQFASVADVIDFQHDSRPLARAMAHLDDETRAAAWTEIEHRIAGSKQPRGWRSRARCRSETHSHQRAGGAWPNSPPHWLELAHGGLLSEELSVAHEHSKHRPFGSLPSRSPSPILRRTSLFPGTARTREGRSCRAVCIVCGPLLPTRIQPPDGLTCMGRISDLDRFRP